MFDKKDPLVGKPAPDIHLVDQNGQEWTMPKQGVSLPPDLSLMGRK